MESFARAAAGVFVAVAVSATAATGSFALVGGTQHSYARAVVTRHGADAVSLSITQSSRPGGPAIRSYQLDMTKLMHMIAISDDFQQFVHVHPSYDRKTGTFRQTLDVSPNHAYTVYVDSSPKGIGQQVFRFAIPAAAGTPVARTPAGVSTPSPQTMSAGPYTVKFARTTLPANAKEMIALDILKGTQPAHDLTPYLGAAGHAVFINTSTLGYVHVHPAIASEAMDMNESAPAKAGPHLMMHVPPLPAGTYKLWFQFQAAGSVYTVPFTLVAR